MSTQRLYHTDSYLTEFDACVVEVADDGRRVYLDQTAFYPTSGGQPHDLGALGGARISDVIDEGERIAHLVESPLRDESAVHGAVDWERRFDQMQQHTGQHLLSAVLEELFGYHTVSVHFGRDYSSLDLDVESVSGQRIVEAETRANAIVAENRAVMTTFEDASEATGLRKESGRTGALRIVSIAGLDRSACGGTHVRRTGEIGLILLRKLERVRKGVRVEFLCGARAARRARADYEVLSRSSNLLSTSIDELPALLEARASELQQALKHERELQQSL